MVQIRQNELITARRRILVKLVDETDCITLETGITSPTIYVSKNGGSPSTGAGSWTEIDATNMPGLYYYECTAGEVDTLGILIINIVKSGVSREFTKEIEIIDQSEFKSDVSALAGLLHENVVSEDTFDTSGNHTGFILYCYDSKTNADLHDKSTGLLYTYTAIVGYDINFNPITFKLTRNP